MIIIGLSKEAIFIYSIVGEGVLGDLIFDAPTIMLALPSNLFNTYLVLLADLSLATRTGEKKVVRNKKCTQ